MSAAVAGMLAGALALLEIYPYSLSIFGYDPLWRKMPRDRWTVPSLAGWTILSVEGLIVAMSYYQRHDMNDFWFFAALTIEYVVAALLAIWFGEHRLPLKTGEKPRSIFSKLDILCLVGAGGSLIVWYQMGTWEIPIAINIVVDGLGMLAILGKVWRMPRSEDFRAWTMTVAGSALSVVALGGVETWTFERSAFPFYMVGVNGLLWLLLFRRYIKCS